MAQAFHPATVLALKLGAIACIIALLGLVLLARWRMSTPSADGAVVAQPIPFSHQHHVGDDGIDCRYCHTSVETSRFAGLPSTDICLTCHSQLFRDAPMLAPLHASAASGQGPPQEQIVPAPWDTPQPGQTTAALSLPDRWRLS